MPLSDKSKCLVTWRGVSEQDFSACRKHADGLPLRYISRTCNLIRIATAALDDRWMMYDLYNRNNIVIFRLWVL